MSVSWFQLEHGVDFLAKHCINGRNTCGSHTKKCDKKDVNLITPKISQEDVTITADTEKQLPIRLSGVLLNSSLCKIVHLGITFKSVEDAFEATKYYYKHEDLSVTRSLCLHVSDIAVGRKYNGFDRMHLPVRPDWYDVRENFLFDLLEQKFAFANTDAYCTLLNTGDADLISGDNLTARVLMMVRTKLFG